MKKGICAILCVLFIFVCHAGNKRFDTMVIFGDSLSDNGNLYRFMWHKIPLSPPYFEGRFSNGNVWIEQLFDVYNNHGQLGSLLNFAVGGASVILTSNGIIPVTLTMELNNYLYWTNNDKKETTLYTIWIGSNNYLNGPTNVEPLTHSVVNLIGKSIEQLISYGGNKFFILNLPDLGRTPQARYKKIEPLLTELTQAHNRKLAAKIDKLKLKYPKVTFVYFDVYSFFIEVIEHATDYGFSNSLDPCYLGNYSGELLNYNLDDSIAINYLNRLDPKFNKKSWEMIKNNPQIREAVATDLFYELLPLKHKKKLLECNGYIFWDGVHPTVQAHFYMAQKARQLLDDAGLETF